ncbi:MAG TPA: hypothetical protein VF824_15750 [Thermoanaerobaculia bacterium]|jgi:hypothetical protein
MLIIQRLIWGAIVVSTLIYLFVIWFITRGSATGSFDAAVSQPLTLILYALALMMFLIGWFVVPRFVGRDAQQRLVVTVAVFESCAVFALVAAFLVHDWRVYLPGWALALLGLFRAWPGRPDELTARGI